MALPGAALFLPLWELACRQALARYQGQLPAGRSANARTLRGILSRAAATGLGRRHDFARLARQPDVEAAYREALPVTDYAACREDFARIADGEADVRFAGRPRLFVSTSGTTGDPRLFPVTARQQNEALRYIALLTPAARAAAVPGLGFRQPTSTLLVASRAGRRTPGGIPVGNPSGAGLRRILALAPPFWVFPPAVLTVTDHPSALYLHALFALRAEGLGCIEAIYCSHVVNWLALIQRRGAELVADLARGSLAGDLVLTPGERRALVPHLAPDPDRAARVAAALAGGSEGLMTRLWPALRVVSTVVSGAFAVSVPRLRSLAGPGPAFYTTCFGATEGMVGINLPGDPAEHYTMALGACHFEFLPLAELDRPAPRAVGFDGLAAGGRYELVLTNHAGLYRYRLGDVVRIQGFAGETPVFAFDHRRGNVLDLVGEKTTEQHLRQALARLAAEQLGGAGRLVDFTVWPDLERLPYRYVVYLELAGDGAPPPAEPLAAALDRLLAVENPSYATLARQNGRLDPLELRLLAPGTFERLLAARRAVAADVNANQVKVPTLLRDPAQRALLEQGRWGSMA